MPTDIDKAIIQLQTALDSQSPHRADLVREATANALLVILLELQKQSAGT